MSSYPSATVVNIGVLNMNRIKNARRITGTLAGLFTLAALSVAPAVLAADQVAEHDHTHGAAATATAKPETTAPKPDAPAMTDMMQKMQDMHAKMMAAKTPAERAAMMSEHMTAMRDGMSMMKGMHGDSAKRMDMMQMMMQMMMDHMSAMGTDAQKPGGTK